jgi:hypothetical protein
LFSALVPCPRQYLSALLTSFNFIQLIVQYPVSFLNHRHLRTPHKSDKTYRPYKHCRHYKHSHIPNMS